MGPPNENVVELISRACTRESGRPALVFDDGAVLTRGDFLALSEEFASYLQGQVSPGDRVAVCLPNRAEFMIAWAAVIANGATLVALNPDVGEQDALQVLDDSSSVLAIVDDERFELLTRLQPNLPSLRTIIRLDGSEPAGLSRYRGSGRLDFASLAVDPASITNVYYTSGSTGRPKGCMVDHRYWLRIVGLYRTTFGFDQHDRLFCPLKFFYNDATWQLLLSLQAGTALVAVRKFSVSRFWDTVRTHEVTQVFGIASIPALLLRAPVSSLDHSHRVKFAVQVGVPAHLQAELVERWGVPWLDAYGLTETGLLVAMPPEHAKSMVGSGSMGLPCAGVDVRLVDEAGEDVPDGEPGELIARAPGAMRGYLNRPEATAEAMVDGWFHTGDLVRRDSRGFLYFVGRAKDIVRRAGENISCVEVEEVLRASDGVLDAAVLPAPDELRGEEVLAVVQRRPGAETPDPAEIIRSCRGKLASHKLPRYIVFSAEDLPRTASMRVAKPALREALDTLGAPWDREESA